MPIIESKPTLVVRMLIRDHMQNAVLRIVLIDSEAKLTWLCNINDNSDPYPMSTIHILDGLAAENGRFTLETNDPWDKGIAVKIGSATDIRNQQHFALVESLVMGDNEKKILNRHGRRMLYAEVLNKVKSTRQTIKSLLLRWWKRGMNYDAVRPDYENCGGERGKQRDPGPDAKKVGPKRTITPGVGINVNNEIRKKLKIAADYWLNRKKPTLKEAIDLIVRLFFSTHDTVENGKVVKVIVEPDAKPTIRQLQYFIKSNYAYRHVRRRREGNKNWDLNEREILGEADSDVQGPGDRFQVDATVADVFLRSQFDRRRIVGRPVIYFVIDVWSRLIVGLYVGFEGPSWIGAMMALVNMVTPKIEFCRQYEIFIVESDWPSHFAPKRIMADRGELMSVVLGHNILKYLRIDIENVTGGRPDLKALVERRFGIVPAKFKQFAPGYVLQDFGDRRSEDYRLKSALNLHEFTQLVILAVIEHNFTPVDRKIPAGMVTEGLTAAPIDVWQWGIENRSGLLKMLTIDQVALNVMPEGNARVTGDGIYFNKAYYYSPTAIRDDWFSQARHKEWNIPISYDPRDFDIGYLRSLDLPNGYEPCKLLEKSSIYSGKSLYEAEELDIDKKRIEAVGENNRQGKRIMIDMQEEEIERKAKAATKAALAESDMTKAEQTAHIPEDRALEKELQRPKETLYLTNDTEFDVPVPDISLDSGTISDEDRVLEELKRIREKRGG